MLVNGGQAGGGDAEGGVMEAERRCEDVAEDEGGYENDKGECGTI